jgi:hypothetical protein
MVPPGTSTAMIEHFSELRGVERDRFTGGQFYRYQTDAHQILALLSDPPWSYSLFCSSNTYYVRFILDDNGDLTHIIIDSSGACL